MKISNNLFTHFTFSVMAGLAINFSAQKAQAQLALSWSEVRLFASTNRFGTAPDGLNSLTTTDKVNSLSALNGLGFEADFHLLPWLKGGIRYAGIWTLMTPDNAPNPPTAFLAVQQTKFGLILRVPLAEKDWLRFDLFGEAGSANTHIDLQTIGSGQGTFSKNGSIYERAGASLGIGWKSMYVFFEAAQEWNNLDGVSFAGSLPNSITAIDLGGMYYGVGLIFSGIPSWVKIGGSKSDK